MDILSTITQILFIILLVIIISQYIGEKNYESYYNNNTPFVKGVSYSNIINNPICDDDRVNIVGINNTCKKNVQDCPLHRSTPARY